tara:strand:+ start:10370 stop:11080 length:711 start_codon:yes stop_codon:yes gene_type:complete
MSDSKQTEVKVEEATEANANDSKQQTPETEVSKTYTADEFNNAMASVRKKTEANVLKKFEDVDVQHYRDLVQKDEAMKLEEQKKRGEFEKILKETAEKKDQDIQQLRSQLNSVKVDGALLNSASKHKAINPEQVVRLVRDKVRLNDAGDVEVIGDNGAPRYTESGELMSPELYVQEFLSENSHFVQAGPSGSGATSNTNAKSVQEVDVSKLDMNDPEQRRLYKEAVAKQSPRAKFF